MSDHLVHIGEVIVNGVLFDPKNGERLHTMDMNELFNSIPRLFDLLDERKIDYVLVGGIAMLVYVEGRNTQDIDLIIARKDLERLPELRIEDDNANFARCWLGELRVDLLFASNELFATVSTEHVAEQNFVERKVRCATAMGLVLLKLFALPSLYRQGRFDRVRAYEKDIADLTESYHLEFSLIFEELDNHLLPSDLEELRVIVSKIEVEIVAARNRFLGGGDDSVT